DEHPLALRRQPHQPRGPLPLVVLVEAHQLTGHPHPEPAGERDEPAGVLGGDDVGLPQGPHQPRRGGTRVTDRRRGEHDLPPLPLSPHPPSLAPRVPATPALPGTPAPRPDTAPAPVGTPEDATTTPDRRPADRRSVDEVEADLRARLLRPGPTDRLWGWLGP